MIANAAIWLTQPPVTATDTKKNKSKDRYSVILIIGLSMISVISPVIEWAYFKDSDKTNILLAVLGLVLLIIGILFRAWSVQTLGKHFTPTVQIKENHQLITSGPYAVVRHPSYFGALIAMTGCAVFLNSYIGIFIVLCSMLYAYYVRINIEEEVLLQSFGSVYKTYQKKVQRLIPFIW